MKKIIEVLKVALVVAVGDVVIEHLLGKSTKQKSAKVDKFKGYYNMLNQWLILRQKGETLEKYFRDNGFKTIAIYGMGEMGNRLYDELCNTEIEVKYAIDKAVGSHFFSELDVRDIDSALDEVDAVIVTATFAFDEISEKLENRINCPIISLNDVVFES